MSIQVRRFQADDADHWDAFCAQSLQATLLHTRRFLSYHGDRFVDQSLILCAPDGRWLGLFPAALQPGDPSIVVSHPGSTYGGVIHQGELAGTPMLTALQAIATHYRRDGRSALRYKAVPHFYHCRPAQDDLYALFRLNATRYRCDLSSTIDLHQRAPLTERRRRSLKKAQKQGVEVRQGVAQLNLLWPILEQNLARKHGAKPVHSLDEIIWLANRFPEHIGLACAWHNQEVIAGSVLFISPTCWHTQYIAASETGYQVCALDAIFDTLIQAATAAGRRWFDFGICNEENGQVLNEGLYQFKTEFGGGGTVHEFFDLSLDQFTD